MREFICTPLDLSEPQAFFASGKVETIVRCKDCVSYERDPNPIDPGWPMRCADCGRDMLDPDGFCAWGERREDA